MRINCVPVTVLTDQHLRAEWVETLMLPAYINRSRQSKSGIVFSDSAEYVLGTGHARFFYDKLRYVENRYEEIRVEMLKRGFRANPSLRLSGDVELFNDWTPTLEDQRLNIERILDRITGNQNGIGTIGIK